MNILFRRQPYKALGFSEKSTDTFYEKYGYFHSKIRVFLMQNIRIFSSTNQTIDFQTIIFNKRIISTLKMKPVGFF